MTSMAKSTVKVTTYINGPFNRLNAFESASLQKLLKNDVKRFEYEDETRISTEHGMMAWAKQAENDMVTYAADLQKSQSRSNPQYNVTFKEVDEEFMNYVEIKEECCVSPAWRKMTQSFSVSCKEAVCRVYEVDANAVEIDCTGTNGRRDW